MEGRQLKRRVDILPPEGKEDRVIMTSVILHPTKNSKNMTDLLYYPTMTAMS
jgi:hypothetical protein